MVKLLNEFWVTFSSIFTGMGITGRHLFKKSVTLQYPEEKAEMVPGVRHQLYVNIDDCIGCNLCAKACPVDCIDIETVKSTDEDDLGTTSNGQKKRLWVTNFEIDMAKCMYCDLCVQPCPTECIYMVPDYEYSQFDRNNLKFQFSDMTPEKVEEVKKKAEEEAARKKAEKEKAAAAKKAAKEKKEKEAKASEGDTGKDDSAKTESKSGADGQKEKKAKTSDSGSTDSKDSETDTKSTSDKSGED